MPFWPELDLIREVEVYLISQSAVFCPACGKGGKVQREKRPGNRF